MGVGNGNDTSSHTTDGTQRVWGGTDVKTFLQNLDKQYLCFMPKPENCITLMK